MTWRDLYPFESRWFDRGAGIRMHYVDEGKGEPVVFVHGNPSWSFHYRELIQELKPDHRCVAFDHVGMGLSDKPGDERYAYTMEQRLADMDKFLAAQGLRENLTLVAHDWGGILASSWAARNPERVARLVLMNTTAFIPEFGLPWELLLARSPLGSLLVRGGNLFVRGAVAWCTIKKLPKDVAAGLAAPYSSWNERRAVLRFVQDIPQRRTDKSWACAKETERLLPALGDKPVLVLWGMKDFVFTPAFLAEWRKRLPRAEYVEFPDAGHFVLEDEAPEIKRRVRGFLAAHPLAASRA